MDTQIDFKFNTPIETLFRETVSRLNYKGYTWYTDGVILLRADLFDPSNNRICLTTECLPSMPAETANYLASGFDSSLQRSVLFKGLAISSFDAYHIWDDFSFEKLEHSEVTLLGQKYREFLEECEVQVLKGHHPSDPVFLYADTGGEEVFAGILAPGNFDLDEWLAGEETRKIIMNTYQQNKQNRQQRLLIPKGSKALVYTGGEQ